MHDNSLKIVFTSYLSEIFALLLPPQKRDVKIWMPFKKFLRCL